MNIVGCVTVRIALRHDPRDPGGPRLAYVGHDDAGQEVRQRTIKRMLRRIVRQAQNKASN